MSSAPTGAPDPTAAFRDIATAREEVARLHRAELELSAGRAETLATIATAAGSAGDAKLAEVLGGSSGLKQAAGRVTALRAELDAVDQAIASARERRRAAIRAVFAAEASALRDQVAALTVDVDARQRRTDELLTALKEHEGIDFAPWRPRTLAHGQTYADPVPYALPRTALLRDQAAALERSAVQLAARRPTDAGAITDATSVDDLIARARSLDTMTIGPRLDAVEAWAHRQAATVTAQFARQPSEIQERMTLRFELAWANGTLDPQRSRAAVVEAPAPAQPWEVAPLVQARAEEHRVHAHDRALAAGSVPAGS